MRLLASAATNELALVVPATALARAYFDGGRQARLARLIAQTYIVLAVLDRTAAKEVGAMRHRTRHADVVDIHVAWLARTLDLAVVTSGPDDMRELGIDPRTIIVV